jgi:hypothetical protein
MSYNREYSKPSVGQASCSYSNLRGTYQGSVANAIAIPSMSEYVVPKFCPQGNGFPGTEYPPSYNTLTRNSTCGGHYTFANAFPAADCMSCQGQKNPRGYSPSGNDYEPFGQFTVRGCASNNLNSCNTQPVAPNPSAPGQSGIMSAFFG